MLRPLDSAIRIALQMFDIVILEIITAINVLLPAKCGRASVHAKGEGAERVRTGEVCKVAEQCALPASRRSFQHDGSALRVQAVRTRLHGAVQQQRRTPHSATANASRLARTVGVTTSCV